MTVPSTDDSAIATQAAEWHARLEAPDMDWDAFALWLDADPAHREAYDAVALLDAEIGDHRDAILATLPANDEVEDDRAVASRRSRWWAGGGIAAAAAVAALIAPQMSFFAAETLVAYQTGPGEIRMIDLKDGSHILLDRNSRLALADGAAPRVEMQGGAAYFDVRHDPSRAFTIRAGDYEVRDIGTKFDLIMAPQMLGVAVSEGKVTVAPKGGDGTAVAAGERIDVATATGDARVRPVDAASVGAWRNGQLVYRDTPLALVAIDLARYGGRPVTVDPAIGDLRVSGVFAIGDGARLVQQIEALLPIKAVVSNGAVRLVGSGAR
ncbi:MAG: FecR domain-containing protein [Pseudomonadota bacterium]